MAISRSVRVGRASTASLECGWPAAGEDQTIVCCQMPGDWCRVTTRREGECLNGSSRRNKYTRPSQSREIYRLTLAFPARRCW